MPPVQRYVSNELTHFVGRHGGECERQYELLVRIIRGGVLRSGKADVRAETENGKPVTKITYSHTVYADKLLSSNDKYEASVVCFADIPIEDLSLHIGKYSTFGLAFVKQFLADRGANPVFYIARRSSTHVTNLAAINSPNAAAIAQAHAARGGGGSWHNYNRAELFDAAEMAQQRVFPTYSAYNGYPQSLQAIPTVNPPLEEADKDVLGSFLGAYLFPYMKFFDVGLPDDHPSNYYMEREWRLYGALSFHVNDIERVLIPRSFAKRLRADLPDYFGQLTFTA